MKKFKFILLLWVGLISISNAQNGFICGIPENPIPVPPKCSTCPITCSDNPHQQEDYGNEWYLTDSNSDILEVQINLHIMQKEANNPQNFTNSQADLDYLNSLDFWINKEVYKRSNYAEQCNGQTTNAPLMQDSKIRVKLNQIFFHVDATGWSNDNSIFSNYCRENYVDNNPAIQNELNIFLCEIPGETTTGVGPGFFSEEQNQVVMNGNYSDYISSAIGTDIWDKARVMAHEINHCLGLLHTFTTSTQNLYPDFECQPSSSYCCSNHNMAYNNTQIYLSPLQVAHMRQALLTTWRKKLLTTVPPCPDLVIVEENATLTIRGTLQMDLNKMVYVKAGGKLVIDDGKITSCDDKWKGVVAEGSLINNNSAEVKIANQGIIENAQTGITDNTSFSNGGVNIDSDNGIFKNNNFGIFLAGPTRYNNPSKIIDTKFEGGGIGIYSYQNKGFEVSGCEFDGQTDYGMVLVNTAIDVEDCEFYTDNVGIYSGKLFPSRRNLVVSGCTFDGNRVDIRSGGSAVNLMEIFDNDFSGDEIGVYFDGDNAYSIDGNNFSGCEVGTMNLSNGSAHNRKRFNSLSNCLIGTLPVYDNERFRFSENCYDNISLSDVFIEGSVNEFQGNIDMGSGNCFSNAAFNIDASNSSTNIKYFREQGANQCFEPTIIGNISLEDANDSPGINCGTGNPFINNQVFCFLGPFSTYEELLQQINSVKVQFQAMKNNTTLPPNAKKAILSYFKECLHRLNSKKASMLVEMGDVEGAVALFKNFNKFEEKIKGYAILMEEGDYEAAGNLLLTYSSEEEEHLEFIEVQKLVLTKLQSNEGSIQLNEQQQSFLYQAALKEYPLAVYGRILWFELYGEILNVNVPALASIQSNSNIAARSIKTEALRFNISPNPSSDFFSIDIEGDVKSNKVIAKMYSINGRLLVAKTLNSNRINIDVADLPSGVYFLSIESDKTVIHREKVSVIN